MTADPPQGDHAGARCPVCGKPAAPRTRPFCSPRCADVDLGRWLTGQYRVPAAAPDGSAEDDGTEG